MSRIPRAILCKENEEAVKQLCSISNIALDLIVYVSHQKMKDLFGDTYFSCEDFCRAMGYNRTNLQRRLTPEQMKDYLGRTEVIYTPLGETVSHPIETLFEAVMYKMTKENIVIPLEKNGETSFSGVQILTDFRIADNFKTRKLTKRLYMPVVSAKLKELLFKNYNLLELNDYRVIPNEKGYRLFYLHLTRMVSLVRYKIEKGEVPEFTMTVDELAGIFCLTQKEKRQRKVKVTRILTLINDRISAAKFGFEYIRGKNERYAYTVRFSFPGSTLDYFNEEFRSVFTKKFYGAVTSYYLTVVVGVHPAVAYKEYASIKADEARNTEFLEWFFSDRDKEEKKRLYRSLFEKTFGCCPEKMGYDVDKMVL